MSPNKDITSDKQFSLEDMYEIFNAGIKWGDNNCETGGKYAEGYSHLKCFNDRIIKLKSKKSS